ncbi:MAG: hypothetical protein H6492_01110 [Candidatus Paracaedibacteraceae bacterium]|nr:hypothetical protein [Candidatus Paracaedibacteraceae bacterium]
MHKTVADPQENLSGKYLLNVLEENAFKGRVKYVYAGVQLFGANTARKWLLLLLCAWKRAALYQG